MREGQDVALPVEQGEAATPVSTTRSLALGIAVGVVLPAFAYALVITRGTLDLWGPEYGWRAYNAYALALAHGHTHVPLHTIGAEGFFINGRVYMYYGMLPAFARWLLMPFVDLRQTPVSLLMTWLFCTAAAAILQIALLRLYWSLATGSWRDKLLLLAASLGVWLGSGPWLILQNGNFYHEPFAVGLLLCAIILYLLVDDAILQVRTPSVRRLCAYALVAGLAVFARQTMAISLYAVTLVVAATPILTERWTAAGFQRTIGRMVLPCLILAGFGAAYMVSNALRFSGHPFPMKSYGYHILFESLRNTGPYFEDKFQRLASMERVGQFHVSRVIPNLIYYLVGGDELRSSLIERLGGGQTVAFGRPVRLLLSWAGPLLLALGGLWAVLRRRPGLTYRLALVAAAGTGGLLQLAYATASYRYASELWTVIALLMFFSLAAGFRDLRGAAGGGLAALVMVVTLVMTGYNLKSSRSLSADAPFEAGSLRRPMPPQLTRLVRE